MVQFKSIILITVIGLAILLSGCVGKQAGTPTPAPTVTPTATPTITATPIVMVTTPTPIATTPMLSSAISVNVRMKAPWNWGNGTYEISSIQATITNLIYNPISIKAQIVSDGQILEEQSFTLRSSSSYSYASTGSYTTNSTNVSLWLFAQGYQPTEYKINAIYS